MHELRAYLKNPQKPIVSLMQALNLRADPNGVCNGVAVMSALYFLKGKQNYIADILKFIYTDAEVAALTKRYQTHARLSEFEWDVVSFLNGVELFQQAQLYRNVHDQEGVNHFNTEIIAALLGVNDIAKVATHFNVYSRVQWLHYLQALAETAQSEKQSFALVIDNHLHCINLTFDAHKQTWQLTNANEIPLVPPSLDCAAQAQRSFSALFESGEYLGVVSSIYLRTKKAEEITSFQQRLAANQNFKIADEKFFTSTQTKLGVTLMQLACYLGDEVILASCLASEGAKALQQKGPGGFTLAHYAAYSGNPNIMNQLIKAGAPVNEACKNGLTPLLIAAIYGHAKVIATLAPLVNLEQPFAIDRTPLLLAAENGQSAAIATLMQAGANAKVQTQDGFSALQVASLFHYRQAEKVLTEQSMQPAR